MTKLAYSLIFTPSTVSKDISHLCSDDKIHIRLDNFDKCCRIEGFERKLTYLLTYMFNYNFFNPVLHKDVSVEKLLKLFFKLLY